MTPVSKHQRKTLCRVVLVTSHAFCCIPPFLGRHRQDHSCCQPLQASYLYGCAQRLVRELQLFRHSRFACQSAQSVFLTACIASIPSAERPSQLGVHLRGVSVSSRPLLATSPEGNGLSCQPIV